jgi:hypothetical protein
VEKETDPEILDTFVESEYDVEDDEYDIQQESFLISRNSRAKTKKKK